MKAAFSNAHGQFKAKAKAAGMSTGAYARKVLANKSRYTPKTRKQASLALTGMKASRAR